MKIQNFLKYLITVITCFTAVLCPACKREMVELGVQLSDRFPNGEVARCVWDLYYKDDKIYLGSGDYDLNSGPTDICAYDLAKNQFIVTGSVEDEAVLKFIEIDGKLLTPGTDPQASWEVGNYYVLNDSGWEKHRVLPHAIHAFDMIEFDKKIYVAIGSDSGYSPLIVSADGGLTFNHVDFYKDGKVVSPLNSPNFSRCYDFFTLKNELYVILVNFYSDYNDFEIYRLDNGKMQFYSDAETFIYGNRASVRLVTACAEHNNLLYLSTNYLYTSVDGDIFNKLELPENQQVSDFFIENNIMYILSYVYKDNQNFEITVYTYNLTNKHFNSVWNFNYQVPPLSFVKVKNNIYIGMGNKNAPHEKNGALIRIGL